MTQPTEDEKEQYEGALKQTPSVDRMECHFCEESLPDELPESDDAVWCDWVLNKDGERFHILAHAYCAMGQIGVERA